MPNLQSVLAQLLNRPLSLAFNRVESCSCCIVREGEALLASRLISAKGINMKQNNDEESCVQGQKVFSSTCGLSTCLVKCGWDQVLSERDALWVLVSWRTICHHLMYCDATYLICNTVMSIPCAVYINMFAPRIHAGMAPIRAAA